MLKSTCHTLNISSFTSIFSWASFFILLIEFLSKIVPPRHIAPPKSEIEAMHSLNISIFQRYRIYRIQKIGFCMSICPYFSFHGITNTFNWALTYDSSSWQRNRCHYASCCWKSYTKFATFVAFVNFLQHTLECFFNFASHFLKSTRRYKLVKLNLNSLICAQIRISTFTFMNK